MESARKKQKATAMGMNASHVAFPIAPCSQPRASSIARLQQQQQHHHPAMIKGKRRKRGRHTKSEAEAAARKENRRRRPAPLFSRPQSGIKKARSPRRRFFFPFTHHKVRVQNAKLDGLDALDGRRRVREAVHRRHDGNAGGRGAFAVDDSLPSFCCSLFSLFARLALSQARAPRARAPAQVRREEQKDRRDAERERELPVSPSLPFAPPSSLAASESRLRLTSPQKKTKNSRRSKSGKVFILPAHPSCDTGKQFSLSVLFAQSCLSISCLHCRGEVVEERLSSRNSKGNESRFVFLLLRRRRSLLFFLSLDLLFIVLRVSKETRREKTSATPARRHHGCPRAHDPAPGGPLRVGRAVLGAPRLEREGTGRRGGGGLALRACPSGGAGPTGRGEGAAADGDAGRGWAADPGLRRVERWSGERKFFFLSLSSRECSSRTTLARSLFFF